MIRSCVLLVLLSSVGLGAADVPKPAFYLPFDNTDQAAISGGSGVPLLSSAADPMLLVRAADAARFKPGRVGACCEIGDAGLAYCASGNFRSDEGTASFWVCPAFRGDDKTVYAAFFGAEKWGMVYKYRDQSSLTFATAKPDRDLFYDCTGSIGTWASGEWHHVVVTWSRTENARRLYRDGVEANSAPFPHHRAFSGGTLYVGNGCEPFDNQTAHALMDEVAVWDKPLPADVIRELHERGARGQALWTGEMRAPVGAANEELAVVSPQTPAVPADAASATPVDTGPRSEIVLDGWWAFLPVPYGQTALPTTGWGWMQVPGYFLGGEGQLVSPDGATGKPGKWQGKPLAQFDALTGCCQRTVTVPAAWQGREVYLDVDGVDALARLYVNGKPLGTLLPWEDEAYRVTDLLRCGGDNAVTIMLTPLSANCATGIYGRVALRALPKAFVRDLAITPRVTQKRIEFSLGCVGEPGDYTLDLMVATTDAPDTPVKTFSQPFTLTGKPATGREAWSRREIVTCAFDWPEARPWTFDDPFCYTVRPEIHAANALVDRAPAVKFGCREFTQDGKLFRLNGVPTHLRGHQLDLAWGDQLKWLAEFDEAGMNSFQLSGPISCQWKTGERGFFHRKSYEDVVDFADTHGLLAVQVMMSAQFLKDAIFQPDVAATFQRRVDKFVRRYGNHPSLGMWYMNFNLAGSHSLWHLTPSKIDGSYKCTDPAFEAKERYSLEAERIVRSLDPRPVFHHHCGNFGSIFTMNTYFGPENPLQEREEWPSKWAASGRMPYVACEHCLYLIPYWFRERKFPLSDVYASEPIFDEFAARLLGRRAYRMLTPELFDLYQMDKPNAGKPIKALTSTHPGYQEVKTIVARHSLRAWRTYGVSGIIFNAVEWDFKTADGKPCPVLAALQRYFNDTDFYIGGTDSKPDGFVNKDHSFFGGETAAKQVVLINDLTHEVKDSIRWELTGPNGAAIAQGERPAVYTPGTPVFLPFSFTLPKVTERTAFSLVARSVAQPSREDRFAIQAFPVPVPPSATGTVLVYDPPGETARLLARAGVTATPLTPESRLDSTALVIVGRKAFGPEFLALAKQLNLEAAVAQGLNLLVFEQAGGNPCGLKLPERSERSVFIAAPGHPFLNGLADADFADLRGESDLMEAYPEPTPDTEKHQFLLPRYFKWSNRGVVATYVYTKPHYIAFRPVLECGFDLVESPLMEARFGSGRVALCQVDVTPRYGTDPVSTRLVANLLADLSRRGTAENATLPVATTGAAPALLSLFNVASEPFAPGKPTQLIAVGTGELPTESKAAILKAAEDGATVVLLPGTAPAAFGVPLRNSHLFGAKLSDLPLTSGLNDGDCYLKKWLDLSMATAGDGWELLAEPGVAAVKTVGKGRLVAILLDPATLEARARVKALRFCNGLLTNLGATRTGAWLAPMGKVYEPNPWEEMPPWIMW
ncbi:MAG: hypothetical protein A3K19_23485 [Lentisphaerae bacterium RIFOXYB12_FULL_65_16]|nr:MAG: hypothetical protein A3K18_20695 [Lentisphaerae bacterium RIFOXYA12_64_32]OGV91231.1 MAG: hypothetical protein A3K19_23485 [Lentisphaerae bacterium RIFOXYB12_FULL_65_16]